MISEIRKSINAILFERVSSPFYGAFIVSWSIWNWRILYLTIFISEDKIVPNKLEYINDNYINLWDMLLIPLIYSVLLLTIGQLISNYSYWLSIYMKQWKIKKRNAIEGQQLLTLEKSIRLRAEMLTMQQEFEQIISDKEKEIQNLNDRLQQANNALSSRNQNHYNPYATGSSGDGEFDEFYNARKAFSQFMKISDHIEKYQKLPEKIDDEIEQYYRLNYIVENIPGEEGKVRLTHKGAWFRKKIFNTEFVRKQDRN